jgi:WXG100 family type VII secretion target
MAMEGMDVEQVNSALSSISSAVGELENLIGSTNNAYQLIEGSWTGPDATQFHSQWPSFASALNQAHTGLSQLQQHLQSNLSAQQSASSGY